MPEDIVQQLRACGHEVIESDNMEQNICDVDIAYSTRIQEERFANKEDANIYRGRFRLNQAIYTKFCDPNTVIMHPLPRDSRAEANELDVDLNENPNLAIFRQADNGVLIRMALFALIFDVVDLVDKFSVAVPWHIRRAQ
jgi:aspartate carbamoyltransferase catalytic subunit